MKDKYITIIAYQHFKTEILELYIFQSFLQAFFT